MGVNIQPIENLALAQGAGEAVGNLEKKLFEIKRNDQIAAELRQMDMQKQRDIFNEQLTLKAEQRARQWELDKMIIRSQNDFAVEEAKRAKEIKEAQIRYDNIQELERERKYPESVTQRMWQDWGKMYYEVDSRAAEKLGVAESIIEPKPKPMSLTQQKSNIEAAMELEGYTPEDLVQFGLNPEQYPNVGGKQNVTSPTSLSFEPTSVEDFIEKVRQLKAINSERAKAYYEQYKGKF